MTGDKISITAIDQVRRMYRFVTETQVGDGDRTRFFRVIDEITLCIFIGRLADDLDAVLVRTDRTIAAQTIEYRLKTILVRIGSKIDIPVKAAVGDVIMDTDSEMIFWSRFG